ncbi:hypothetical protein AYO49_03630 [Verrucomicrobiaceae bacterium SCGC AG-212-N21]|nr:hypothetical protein AYO49_03630 [Verrucomicrobiaceae bacterium SCGC AG-212-N21]
MGGIKTLAPQVVTTPSTATTTPTDVPDVSTLSKDHDVKPAKGALSRVAAAIGSAIRGAFKSLSNLKVALKTPPPDAARVGKPFKTLGHAKAAFVNQCRERMQAMDAGVADTLSMRTARNVEGLSNQQKVDVYHYTNERSTVGYHAMNALIRGSLDPSQFASDKLNEVKQNLSAAFGLDRMEARVPADQRQEFRKFAEDYVMCTMAQKAMNVREGLAKLPIHQGITDRGMADFPGKVDKLKSMLSSPGKVDFAYEAAFASSTSKVQTPAQVKSHPVNRAGFTNDISLLTICRAGKDVQAVSALSREAEILFPSSARFEVFGHKEVQGSGSDTGTASQAAKAKQVFFQLELSAEDHSAFKELEGLQKKMDADAGYKPNASEQKALTHAKDFNAYVQGQMGEFAKLGWDGDLAPPTPNTCKFFDEVMAEAAKRTT